LPTISRNDLADGTEEGGLRFRASRPDDGDGLVDLFAAVYGEHWRERTSSWRYLPPAPCRSLIWVAESDGRIVGAQPSHEVALRFDGEVLRGSLLLDVMTHPDYRRRGVFSGVVEGLRRALHADGIHALLTTPNHLAARGFATLPAWQLAGELVPLVLPVRWKALILPDGRGGPGAPAGGGEARESPAAGRAAPRPAAEDPRAQTLWRRFSAWSGTCIVRDPAFLAWRFGGHAGRPYHLEACGSPTEWTALAVTTPGRLLNRRVLFLADLIAASPDGQELTDLLGSVARQAADRGEAAVVAYMAPDSRLIGALRRSGFRTVPRLLRPRPYAVWMATDLAGESAARLRRLAGWHMTLADSDLA